MMAESAEGEVRYLLSDGLGSIRQAVDGNAEVVSSDEFDPYGNPLTFHVSRFTPYGYTGEWWHSYIKLLHLRARWYMPETGTFLSKDPVEDEPPYQYVRGNPVNSVDASGKFPTCQTCGTQKPTFTKLPVPEANITSFNGFGPNNFAFRIIPNRWYEFSEYQHSGFDFMARSGTPVLAVADQGDVIFASATQSRFGARPGNIVIKYGDYVVIYGHVGHVNPFLDRLRDAGEKVPAGLVLGAVGRDTGVNGVPHLHLEVRRIAGGGPPDDPCNPNQDALLDQTTKPTQLVNPFPFFELGGLGGAIRQFATIPGDGGNFEWQDQDGKRWAKDLDVDNNGYPDQIGFGGNPSQIHPENLDLNTVQEIQIGNSRNYWDNAWIIANDETDKLPNESGAGLPRFNCESIGNGQSACQWLLQ